MPAEKKRTFYSPAAMQERLSGQGVRAFAYCDSDGRPIAFLRAYTHPGLGTYVSDFVTDVRSRPALTGASLIGHALAALQEAKGHIFLIAGTSKEAETYRNNFGFTNVTLKPVDLNLPDAAKGASMQFKLGLFKPQEILSDRVPARLKQLDFIMLPPTTQLPKGRPLI